MFMQTEFVSYNIRNNFDLKKASALQTWYV